MGAKPNNNPKNKKALLEFQKKLLERARATEKDAKAEKIKGNREFWESKMPDKYKDAKHTNLSPDLLGKIKNASLRPPFNKHIIIKGNHATTTLHVAYSIVYGLISNGVITPSEVRKSSLLDGYNNINGIYQSRGWKDRFFDKNAKVLIIEGASKSITNLAQRGEEQFWREVEDFTKEQEVLVIITYLKDKDESAKEVFIPFLSSDPGINSSLIKKSAFVPIKEKEENEIETKQREVNRGL